MQQGESRQGYLNKQLEHLMEYKAHKEEILTIKF